MNKTIVWGITLLLLVSLGCEIDEGIDLVSLDDKEVIIQHENLDGRLSKENLGVVSLRGIPDEPIDKILKSAKIEPEDDIVSDLPLVLVAEVSAPEYEGVTLRATHVNIHGDYAYVSYNHEGDIYLGAVDVIDISDMDNPQLVESAIFPETDISSLVYKNNTLYLAGAKSTLNEDGSDPAVLLRMPLDAGLLTEELVYSDMAGYVATDVAVGNNTYYGVSGDNGILGAFSIADNSLQASVNISDLRAVVVVDNQVVVLSGATGIHVFDTSDLSEKGSFETSRDQGEAKRTIDFYDGSVLAAEGANGVGVYDLSSGDKRITIPVANSEGLDVDPSEVVSNAVSVNDEYIFIANGAAGISVFRMASGAVDDLLSFGSLDLSGSANYVKSEGDHVFVADGVGGLQILKMIQADPEEGEADCSEYPSYGGGNWLNVNSNEDQAYGGSASLAGVNVNANLTWCGSLAVSKHININSGGVFHMKGSLSQGSSGQAIAINANSTLRIEGSLVVYGDLILNSNSTLEFVGSGSSITVHGNVTKGDNVTITGDYTDTNNSLD